MMTKQEFLSKLRSGLVGLPQNEVEERFEFYREMIDDRMEEGISEEEAISDIGDVDEVISRIISEIPLTKIVKEKITPNKKFKAWEIVLLILGSPIWLSLIIAAIAVVLAVYISLWSVIISLWAAFGSVVGCAFGGILSGAFFVINGNIIKGIALIGAGITLLGLSILFFYGCKAATDGIIKLTKVIALKIKNCFVKKEEA